MTTYSDIAAALTETLKGLIPGVKIYSAARIEKIERPSFNFTLKPILTEAANMRTRHNIVSATVEYFQKVKSEADMYDIAGKLRDALGFAYRVGKRHLDVTDFDFDFVGQDRNVLEMSITFDYFDEIVIDEHAETMREAIIDIKLKEVYE